MLILKLAVLLVVANGTPVIARNLLGERFSFPVDGGLRFLDHQPLFGPSKTLRGIFFSLITTAGCASLFGLGWKTGLLIAAFAMLGDLSASFVKRRLKMPPSSKAPGLDQIPESLFPLLACKNLLSLTATEIAAAVVIFIAAEVLLSKILYKLHIRAHPY